MILLICGPLAMGFGVLGCVMAIGSTMFHHWYVIADERKCQESYGTERYFDSKVECVKLHTLSKICLVFSGMFMGSAIILLVLGVVIWFNA